MIAATAERPQNINFRITLLCDRLDRKREVGVILDRIVPQYLNIVPTYIAFQELGSYGVKISDQEPGGDSEGVKGRKASVRSDHIRHPVVLA